MFLFCRRYLSFNIFRWSSAVASYLIGYVLPADKVFILSEVRLVSSTLKIWNEPPTPTSSVVKRNNQQWTYAVEVVPEGSTSSCFPPRAGSIFIGILNNYFNSSAYRRKTSLSGWFRFRYHVWAIKIAILLHAQLQLIAHLTLLRCL